MIIKLATARRSKRLPQMPRGYRAKHTFDDLLGESPAWRRQLDLAKSAAATDAQVLIIGESDTGKEMVAQSIHSTGARARSRVHRY
jgi:transcriptional regulator with PAS, ATPase and Fis domain